jgi:hypothetical protein
LNILITLAEEYKFISSAVPVKSYRWLSIVM